MKELTEKESVEVNGGGIVGKVVEWLLDQLTPSDVIPPVKL